MFSGIMLSTGKHRAGSKQHSRFLQCAIQTPTAPFPPKPAVKWKDLTHWHTVCCSPPRQYDLPF